MEEVLFIQVQPTEWVSLTSKVIISYSIRNKRFYIIAGGIDQSVNDAYTKMIVRLLRAKSFGTPDFSACEGLMIDD